MLEIILFYVCFSYVAVGLSLCFLFSPLTSALAQQSAFHLTNNKHTQNLVKKVAIGIIFILLIFLWLPFFVVAECE